MADGVAPWAVLLTIAAVIGVVAQRLRFPYSVGLVVSGIGLALLHWQPSITLSRDVVYSTLLPPLIFQAAFELRWETLKTDLALVALLSTIGVAVAALVAAATMTLLVHWSLGPAIIFGIVIAATDPISVVSTLKEIGAHDRLTRIIEAESLFNDGTAAVLFALGISFVDGSSLTYAETAVSLGGAIVVGPLVGVLVASIVLFFVRGTDDRLLELSLTVVAAYGSFFLAEEFGGSGVLATLTTGILVGNLGSRWSVFSSGDDATIRFGWEFITFVASSLVFLLIGLAEGQEGFIGLGLPAGAAVVAALTGRAAGVYPLCALFSGSAQRVPALQQHALVWAGLRGALGLALALSIPEGIPWRRAVISATFAVVAFSVIIQGLTCRPLLRRASTRNWH